MSSKNNETEERRNGARKAMSGTRRRRLRRAALGVLALVGVALVVLALLPSPVEVDVARVTRGDVRVTIDEDGVTRVKDRWVVIAPLAGSLARLELRAGDSVAEGDVIARILPSTSPLLDARARSELDARIAALTAGVRQAEASLARARTAHEAATREAARVRALAGQGAISARDLERAELDVRARAEETTSAEFGVRIARHELAMARSASAPATRGGDAQETFEVRSPVSGRVLRVLRADDGPVAPGAALLEIGDPAALEVVVDVLTSDAVRITPGDAVRLARWGGPDELEARVRLVEPSGRTRVSALGVEEQRVDVVVDLVAPRSRWTALGDGYRVEASIVVDAARGALHVPELCLFGSGGALAVYVVEEGRARRRAVRVGRRNGLVAEVVSGLREREVVVLHPSERVREGVRVRPR